MSCWALGMAWVLSAVSLAVSFSSDLDAGVLSRMMLCALPWIALAGLPRGVKSVRNARRPWWSYHACLLPVLAVGLGLDYAACLEPFALVRLGCWVFVITGLLAWAASRSAGSAGYACLWTVLIPLPFACVALPDQSWLNSNGLNSVVAATPAGWALNELVSRTSQSEFGFARGADLGLVLSMALFFALSFLFRSEGAQS